MVTCIMMKRGVLYFRMRLPKALADRWQKREIRQKIPSRSLQKVEQVCKLLREQLKGFFTVAEKTNWTYEQLQELLKAAVHLHLEVLEAGIDDMVLDGKDSSADIASYRKVFEDDISNMRQFLVRKDDSYAADQLQLTAQRNFNRSLDDISILALHQLGKEYYTMRIKIDKIGIEHLNGNYDTEFDQQRGFGSLVTPESSSQMDIKPEKPAPIYLLKEMTEEYIAYKKSSGKWTANTENNCRTSLNLLCEYFGNECPLHTITRDRMYEMRENVIRRLPVRRNTDSRYRNLPLQQAIKLDTEKKISIATVNEYLFDFSSFFKWCVSYKEILQKNPVIELKIEDPVAPDEKRYPYSQSDIERIFRQLKELQDVNDYKQLERTWTILIAMFSGMRLNEICQLFLDDIVQTDGIPYFKLPGSHPTQRVKNAYSKRAVPIHPALLNHGFLGYVISLRGKPDKNGLERLFPSYTWSPHSRYTKNFENFFNKFNREHITKDTLKSFHSFRHTVSTYLENQPNVETFQVNRLLGHNSKTTTEQRYAKSDIKRLREVLSLLQYNSDPFEILGWPCLSDHDVAEQIKLLPVLERF